MIPLIDSNTPANNFEKDLPRFDSIGQFSQPVDVAVGANKDYNPDSDFVYIVDQANCRVVRLRYDKILDSLVWISTFGENILQFPTAIAYADYGSPDRIDHDVYVADAGSAGFYRFSASGIYESDYVGFGSGISLMGYPTGVAVSPGVNGGTYIYISDSYNHNIARFISGTFGDIMAEQQYNFPISPLPYVAAVDVDSWGNVYVVDSYNHKITVLDGDLKRLLFEFGSEGTDQGELESPCDIFINKKINGNEIVICEWWGQLSGIRCFKVNSNLNSAKPTKP